MHLPAYTKSITHPWGPSSGYLTDGIFSSFLYFSATPPLGLGKYNQSAPRMQRITNKNSSSLLCAIVPTLHTGL